MRTTDIEAPMLPYAIRVLQGELITLPSDSLGAACVREAIKALTCLYEDTPICMHNLPVD